MGECLRRWITRRASKGDEKQAAATCTAARQFGVGEPGGVETIIHFAIFWRRPGRKNFSCVLARVRVDLPNCFGTLEWASTRQSIRRHLVKRSSATCWQHLGTSKVRHSGGLEKVRSRGVEQGDVDGPMEATSHWLISPRRLEAHFTNNRQAGNCPWRLAASSRPLRTAWRQGNSVHVWSPDTAGGVAPELEVMANSQLLDLWYVDDGDV